jgi:hypothetical protein
MIRESIGRASSIAQLFAAATLALVGARFGVAGILFAVRERAPTLESARAPGPIAPKPLPSATASPAQPKGEPVKVGTSLRLPMVITIGPDRSEVRIDGVKVGQTPYIGDVSCRAGEDVRIDLLPAKGQPQSFTKKCVPGTIRIGD